MKIPEQSKVPPHAGKVMQSRTLAGNIDIALRARLLGRLLGSVGPLALKVVGGGVFAKYVRHARRPKIPVSFEDAARATPGQVCDVVRYVEQSNPKLIDRLMTALSRITKRRQRC
ncbi:MAG TPA: hypothetical protein VGK75_18480 [Casimicrobiaceae bacterium]